MLSAFENAIAARSQRSWFAASLLVSATIACAATAQPYLITELPAPAGYERPGPVGVNDLGQAVGTIPLVNGGTRPFLFDNGAITILPTYGNLYNSATAINNAGQIAGYVASQGWYGYRVVMWEDGQMVEDFGVLTGVQGDNSYGWAISETGQIAGKSDFDTGGWHAVLCENGAMTDLGPTNAFYSEAHGINDAGVVVGWARFQTGDRAARWDANGVQDLGSLSQGSFGISEATDVNNFGQIVGWTSVGTCYACDSAFLWELGTMLDLPELPGEIRSSAEAINDNGTIVGWSEDDEGRHAAMWRDGLVYDLTALLVNGAGWQLNYAYDISENGRIAGQGRKDGEFAGFLLAPVATGDLNCDGAVNAADIDPFVLALTDPAGYDSDYPQCDRMLADADADGAVTAADIDPFVALLAGD